MDAGEPGEGEPPWRLSSSARTSAASDASGTAAASPRHRCAKEETGRAAYGATTRPARRSGREHRDAELARAVDEVLGDAGAGEGQVRVVLDIRSG